MEKTFHKFFASTEPKSARTVFLIRNYRTKWEKTETHGAEPDASINKA